MRDGMTLGEFLKETDALTYLNSLKVTLTEIKDELSTQDELRDYQNQSAERTKKLLRKADNTYRLITKLASQQAPVASNLVVDDELDRLEELEELMSQNGGG